MCSIAATHLTILPMLPAWASISHEKNFFSCLTVRQDVKEAYSVYLMVSTIFLGMHGWSLFRIIDQKQYSNILVQLWPFLSE